MFLRLLTYFALGATLVVVWCFIETTRLWSPAATRSEQRPSALMTPSDATATDEAAGLMPTAQAASGTPSEAFQPDARPSSGSLGMSTGVDEADGFAASAEPSDRRGWGPPRDEPPLWEILRPKEELPAHDDFEAPPPAAVGPRQHRAESTDEGNQELDVDALQDTYLEALRMLVYEDR